MKTSSLAKLQPGDIVLLYPIEGSYWERDSHGVFAGWTDPDSMVSKLRLPIIVPAHHIGKSVCPSDEKRCAGGKLTEWGLGAGFYSERLIDAPIMDGVTYDE